MFRILREDLRRYCDKGHFACYEPSLLSIVCYRLGQWIRRFPKPFQLVLMPLFIPFSMIITLLTGIHLPRGAKIGPGLRIHHFGCIILHPAVRIGRNCTLRHEVTIGNRYNDDVPVIGDNVSIGAGAKILGAIHIGNNAKIGANAVVLNHVPNGASAIGIPARIILHKNHENSHRS